MASAAAPANWPSASALLALLALALVYAPPELITVLAYDRAAIMSGQWWRLWSAHLVHYSAWHALTDGAMLLLCGALLEPLLGTRRLCVALAGAAPLIALILLLTVPAMAHYRGLSALDVMMATMAMGALWQQHPRARPWLALMAALLSMKTAGEALGLLSGTGALPAGVRVMWQAHALGAACGLLAISALLYRRST